MLQWKKAGQKPAFFFSRDSFVSAAGAALASRQPLSIAGPLSPLHILDNGRLGGWDNRPMRRRHLHRPIASLALVAMLLLSILPTLGRLAGEAAAPAAHAGTGPGGTHGSDLASMAHMAHATHAAHERPSIPSVPPSHDGHGAHDCAYCPLLAGLASLPMPPGIPASIREADTVPSIGIADVPVVLRTSSLGSRGPPTRKG